MPIDHHIDHDRRLVRARCLGILTDEDIFGYQREVWSRPDVSGYDELVDLSEVEEIALPSAGRVRELARLSASMDPRSPSSKLAIVAPDDLAFGLGRVYEAYREGNDQSTKRVGLFRSLADALTFLGLGGESGNRVRSPLGETPNRTRVVVADHESAYGRGDLGTVHRVDAISRGPLYHVAMDKAGGTDTTVIFAAGEIEPDV